MDKYFAPDLDFIPYMYVFGGPENPITGREDFYSMLTGHPEDYEQFVVHDVFVDEKRMVSVAFLQATIYETATDTVKVQKDYLPLYELALDEPESSRSRPSGSSGRLRRPRWMPRPTYSPSGALTLEGNEGM